MLMSVLRLITILWYLSFIMGNFSPHFMFFLNVVFLGSIKKFLKFGFGNGFFWWGVYVFFRIIIGYFRILQSETYSIYDTLWYDIATSEDTTKWNNYGATATYSSNGTNLKYGTDYRYQAIFSLEDGMVIEFDINIPSTVTANPNLYIKGSQRYFTEQGFARDTWHHTKITCQNGRYDLYSDGTFKAGAEYTAANKIFQFRTTDGAELTFKNFVVYPI